MAKVGDIGRYVGLGGHRIHLPVLRFVERRPIRAVDHFRGPGVVVVVEACRRFQVSFSEYLTGVLLKPLMCNAVLLGVILASRMLNDNMNLPEAAMWGAMGGLGVVALYWKFLLTDELRTDLRGKFGRRKPAASRSID